MRNQNVNVEDITEYFQKAMCIQKELWENLGKLI
jgi:hypothetical protein